MLNPTTLGNLNDLIDTVTTSTAPTIIQIPSGHYLELVYALTQRLPGRFLTTLPLALNPFSPKTEEAELIEAYEHAVPQVTWISSSDFEAGLSNPEDWKSFQWLLVSASLDPLVYPILAQISENLPQLILISLQPSSIQPLQRFLPNAWVYSIELATHPVEIQSIPTMIPLNNSDFLRQTAALVASLHQSSILGDFLVFAATPLDAATLLKLLQQSQLVEALIVPAFAGNFDWNLLIQPVSSSSTLARELFPPARKIYLVTSAWAELIPVDPLTLVVDTLIEPREVLSPAGGRRWILNYETLTQANQRSGRLGLTKAGLGYRLGSSELLRPSYPPIPLQPRDIVKLLDLGFNPSTLLESDSVNPLIRQMSQFGLLEDQDSQLTVTPAGKFVTALPLSLHHATVLWRWYRYDYPIFPGLAIMSMLDVAENGTTFLVLPEKRPDQDRSVYIVDVEVAQRQFYENFGGYSDVETLLNVVSTLFNDIGGPDGSSNDVLAWCRQYHVNATKISEVLTIIHSSIHVLRELNIDVVTGPFNPENVLTQLRPILAEVYSNWLMQLELVASIPHYRDGQGRRYRLEMLTATNSFETRPPIFIVALLTTQTSEVYPQGGGTQGWAINVAINVTSKEVLPIIQTPRDDVDGILVDEALDLHQIPESFDAVIPRKSRRLQQSRPSRPLRQSRPKRI